MLLFFCDVGLREDRRGRDPQRLTEHRVVCATDKFRKYGGDSQLRICWVHVIVAGL